MIILEKILQKYLKKLTFLPEASHISIESDGYLVFISSGKHISTKMNELMNDLLIMFIDRHISTNTLFE